MNEVLEFEFSMNEYPLSSYALQAIGENNALVKELWPSVYILRSDKVKKAYVGESANIMVRLKSHIGHEQKKVMDKVIVVTSPHFNKSATLDIESNLIRYFDADKTYSLLNGNAGLSSQSYYQKHLYAELFVDIWKELKAQRIVRSSLNQLTNSDYFKYSPYKSLNQDQLDAVLAILKTLTQENSVPSTFVKGSAGTGKTVVAIFLMKLLLGGTDGYNEESLDEDAVEIVERVKVFKKEYPDPKIALVVPMASLRDTLKRVFKSVAGLSDKNVIGPSEVVHQHYDLLLIDEAHRLKQRKNLVGYASFDRTNKALQLGTDATELDWVLLKSSRRILFYDPAQSVRPTDVPKEVFAKLNGVDKPLELKSQMRVEGGIDYIDFIDRLFDGKLDDRELFMPNSRYAFNLFTDINAMAAHIAKKEKEEGLARLVAGFSWPWISNKTGREHERDIKIGTFERQWNKSPINWVNSPNAIDEVGCIHTVQGYDLNYAGVILGNEISYDPVEKGIVIKPEHYHDRNGKAGIKDANDLKEYIKNIYKTLFFRGIKGTFVYACDNNLRDYLQSHIVHFDDRHFT